MTLATASVRENVFVISFTASFAVTDLARAFSMGEISPSVLALMAEIFFSLRAGVTVFSPVSGFSFNSMTACPPTSPVT